MGCGPALKKPSATSREDHLGDDAGGCGHQHEVAPQADPGSFSKWIQQRHRGLNTWADWPSSCWRSKSESRPTSGMLARISARGFLGGRWRVSSRMARCSASALRPLAAARCFRACTRDSSSPRTSKLVMVISRQESPEQAPYCIPAHKNGRLTCSEDRQVIAMLSP